MTKTAILIANLGTPDNCDEKSVRKYLSEFLSDRRVIDEPAWKWLPILHGIVLRFRPKKSAELYKSIWTEDGSPLMYYSKKQQVELQKRFEDDNIPVSLAMTYGNPSIKSELKKLQQWGVEKLIILPMYPQYSSTTTAPIWDQVTSEIQTWKSIPNVTFIRDYPDEEKYINCLVDDINNYLENEGEPDTLILSYHGIPLKYVEDGDDYPDRCHLTTKAIKKHFPNLNIIHCYQSKFGNDPWLEPDTGETIVKLAKDGHDHLAVIAPAFTADCLETFEELEREYAEDYFNAGGKKYNYIKAVNAKPLFIDSLENTIRKHL